MVKFNILKNDIMSMYEFIKNNSVDYSKNLISKEELNGGD